MCLRLAVGEPEPVLFGLAEEVVHGLLMLGVDRFVLEEEAATVQVQGDPGRQVVLVLALAFDDFAVTLVDPFVQVAERLDGRCDVNVKPQVPHPSEARRDIQRDVVVVRTSGEPRPHAVVVLEFRQFA